jgi:hypothetical protein
MNDTLKYFLRFLLFLAVQLVFFNSLNLGTYLFPAPYILFRYFFRVSIQLPGFLSGLLTLVCVLMSLEAEFLD